MESHVSFYNLNDGYNYAHWVFRTLHVEPSLWTTFSCKNSSDWHGMLLVFWYFSFIKITAYIQRKSFVLITPLTKLERVFIT